MYIICDKCDWTIAAKPYHVGKPCLRCEGKMRELTDKDEKRLKIK